MDDRVQHRLHVKYTGCGKTDGAMMSSRYDDARAAGPRSPTKHKQVLVLDRIDTHDFNRYYTVFPAPDFASWESPRKCPL